MHPILISSIIRWKAFSNYNKAKVFLKAYSIFPTQTISQGIFVNYVPSTCFYIKFLAPFWKFHLNIENSLWSFMHPILISSIIRWKAFSNYVEWGQGLFESALIFFPPKRFH